MKRTKDLKELSKVFKRAGKKDIRLGQAIEIALNKKKIDLFNIENDLLLKLLEESFPKEEKESKILRQLEEGKDRFYLREFNNIKKEKIYEEAEKAIPDGAVIEITAKSIGSGYEFSFDKTEEGFLVIDASHRKSLNGKVFKTLKKMMKKMPKPTSVYRDDLSWMDR